MTTASSLSSADSLPSTDRLTRFEGWGMVDVAAGYAWQARSVDEIRDVLKLARSKGLSIVPRGAGYSYTDGALNSEEIVLDLTRMNQILAWDAATGIITVESGATIRDVWSKTLPDGWWPKVVPGTMAPTIGGCLAMNIHGKNAWIAGSIGEYVLAFDLLLTSGELVTITRESNSELFLAAIGGIGMLGIITSITMQMYKVHSGLIESRSRSARSLDDMFAVFAEESPTASYLVGWIDGFARNEHLGRGLVNRGDFRLAEDPATLPLAKQDLPPKIMGIMPRSEIWRMMKPMFNDPMMHFANQMQFRMGSKSPETVRLKPHAQFHFFHDYMPNWKRAWLPGGLRQFQVFVPTEQAPSAFRDLLLIAQKAGIAPYLCVFKQHREDPFLLQYQVNGFSLSMDFHATAQNRQQIQAMLLRMRERVLAASGRWYLAKDDLLDAQTYRATVGVDRYDAFLALKNQYDADRVLQSNLFRRVFAK